jgi:hypothetical protein
MVSNMRASVTVRLDIFWLFFIRNGQNGPRHLPAGFLRLVSGNERDGRCLASDNGRRL